MRPNFLNCFFIALASVGLTTSGDASICKNGLAHLKGIALSVAARSVARVAQNGKYAKKNLYLNGEEDFFVTTGTFPLGAGAFGVVFPLKIEGSQKSAEKFLQHGGAEIIVKFPHHTALSTVNKITSDSIVAEWNAENDVFAFCAEMGFAPHYALQRTILHASLDTEPPFLIKKRANGVSLVMYDGNKKLSPDQIIALQELFYFIVFLEKESLRVLGKRISIDIKPDNLYWDGEGWRFYEISRTPQDNTFFTQDGFSGYLSILAGYTRN